MKRNFFKPARHRPLHPSPFPLTGTYGGSPPYAPLRTLRAGCARGAARSAGTSGGDAYPFGHLVATCTPFPLHGSSLPLCSTPRGWAAHGMLRECETARCLPRCAPRTHIVKPPRKKDTSVTSTVGFEFFLPLPPDLAHKHRRISPQVVSKKSPTGYAVNTSGFTGRFVFYL